MIKVALTGNIGCGKSTVAKLFRKLGAYTLDADEIIKGFYRKGHPVYREVVRHFGREVLDRSGNIDRKRLADKVFRDKDKLRLLEEITHKELYRKLEEFYKKLPPSAVVFVEASLLIEKGTYRNYDYTVVVYAPYEVCKKRAIERGMSPHDFKRRWSLQMPIEEKVKFADFVIDNSGSLKETEKQAKQVFQKITGEKAP
jgi:dephospho-CoA kinase